MPTVPDYPDTAPPWLPAEQLEQMRDALAGAIADLAILDCPPSASTVVGYIAMRRETSRVHAARREYLRATPLSRLLGVTA